MVQGRRVLLLP